MTPVGPSDLPPSWRDHRDAEVQVPPPPGPDAPAFYVSIGAFQGEAYRRNAFAAHTEAEVDALVARTGLRPGDRVLDVGCGNGRHLRALAHRGVSGIGIDVSPDLVTAARAAVEAERGGWPTGVDLRFAVADARDPQSVAAIVDEPVDVAWTLCQGAFGTHPGSDAAVLSGLVDAVRPGGVIVVTAFHALFAARHLVEGDAFDSVHLVHHQVSEVRGSDDARARFDLWTAAYTVRDLLRLAADTGVSVIDVAGCEPGRYDGDGVRLDDPELLLVGSVLGTSG